VDNFGFLWDSDRNRAVAAGLPPSSCAVIRHPFDPFFLERGPPSLGPRLSGILGPVGRRVVFTGPPEGSRGVDDMLRLAHLLPSDSPTQVVLLLRDRRYSDPNLARTRIGAHELLVVRGLLSRQELRAAYQVSHIAVFPYRFVRTGLPLVALEAVATGLPVVTTRVHPIRELEGRTGLVFAEPRNPPGLARAIQEVFEDDTLKEIQRRNQEWIRTTPDWTAVARTFVSLSGY
jgi:glycosyltransferase involved in cell wall biosynthesis